MVHTRFHNNTTTLSPSLFLSPNAIQTSRPLGILMDSYYSYQNSQQRICWVSISGARGLVTRKCTPRKTGTVLEPCWNLSLLGCKAGLIIIIYQLPLAQTRRIQPQRGALLLGRSILTVLEILVPVLQPFCEQLKNPDASHWAESSVFQIHCKAWPWKVIVSQYLFV